MPTFIQVKWTYCNECMIEFVCSNYELYFEIVNINFTSVKHTVIKACSNKLEQGENNVLFNVCVCSY